MNEKIRPVISVIFAVCITAGFFLGKLDAAVFMTVASSAITWWYKTKDNEKTKQ